MRGAVADVLLAILAIFLPPATVFIKRGCTLSLLLNVILCIVGFWILGTL